MPERLELGTAVHCTDGELGELADVVITPGSMRVADLVVRPHHHIGGPALLVPIETAEGSHWGELIQLECTKEDAKRFPAIREAAALRPGEAPAAGPGWDVGIQDVVAVPGSTSMDMVPTPDELDPLVEVTYDRIPAGKIELRHQSAVVSSDQHLVGRIDAFVVEGDEITHLILGRGHMWSRRDVTIPISSLASVKTDEVNLAITRNEVGRLPSVRLHKSWFS